MNAETDIAKAKTYSDLRKYKHITDIPVDDYVNINTVYISDIDILINKKHVYHNIFIKLINIEYLYVEEKGKIDMTILNNNKLIKNMTNFKKLKVFTQLFNKNPDLNTYAINNDKMLIVVSNNIIPSIPKKIKYLQILNKNDLNFNNLPVDIEHLKINVINIKKIQLDNLPASLKSLTIYYNKEKDEKTLTKIKLPHNCDLILDKFCII